MTEVPSNIKRIGIITLYSKVSLYSKIQTSKKIWQWDFDTNIKFKITSNKDIPTIR